MVRLLLEQRARVSIRDTRKETALHKACYFGIQYSNIDRWSFYMEIRLQLATLLLEKGIDVNATNDFGETALYKAIKRYRPNLASYLLEMGAYVEVRNDREKEMTRNSAMQSVKKPARPLRLVSDIQIADQIESNSVLHLAVRRGQHSVVRKLIDRGVDVNTIDSCCRTALDCAQKNNDHDMIRMLISAGAASEDTVREDHDTTHGFNLVYCR